MNVLIRRLIAPRRQVSPEEASDRLRRARSVLLVKPHHQLGDLFVATPVIRNLRLALPNTRLVFLAGRYNAPAVLDNPDLDEVLVARLRGPRAVLDSPFMVRRLRRERFDVALVLSSISHSLSAVAFARQARPGCVLGLDDAPYGSRFAENGYDCVLAPPDDLKTHIVDYNLTLLERLGIPIRERRHVLGVTPEQRQHGEELLLSRLPSGPRLGIQAGGNPRHPDRHWPADRYAEIATRARRAGWAVVVLGQSPGGAMLTQDSEGARLPVLMDLEFDRYKGVLASLDGFLTHDGGPIHVAAGVGTPSYFVFLSTPPWRWAPHGPQVHVWEEYTRTPSVEELWSQLEPLLSTWAAEAVTA